MYRVKIGTVNYWCTKINGIELLSPTFKGLLETIMAFRDIHKV